MTKARKTRYCVKKSKDNADTEEQYAKDFTGSVMPETQLTIPPSISVLSTYSPQEKLAKRVESIATSTDSEHLTISRWPSRPPEFDNGANQDGFTSCQRVHHEGTL